MPPLTVLTSKLAPLLAANIDTDQIIPAQLVNVVGAEALADALFANRRAADPAFLLNQPEMRGRQIILAGPNFGCGSSREAAVWALIAGGFRAAIGISFNETFSNNSLQNGFLSLPVPPELHRRVSNALSENLDIEVTIDLSAQRITASGAGIDDTFAFDAFAKHLLTEGRDELGYLLERRDMISAFECRTHGAPAGSGIGHAR